MIVYSARRERCHRTLNAKRRAYSLLVRTLFLAYLTTGSPRLSSSSIGTVVLTYTLRRRPVMCGVEEGCSGAACCSCFFFSLLKNREPFFLTDFRRSARCSWRMDSAIVDAAVRTVRRRSSGSTLSSSSVSGSSVRRRKGAMGVRRTQSQPGRRMGRKGVEKEVRDAGEEREMRAGRGGGWDQLPRRAWLRAHSRTPKPLLFLLHPAFLGLPLPKVGSFCILDTERERDMLFRASFCTYREVFCSILTHPDRALS